MTYVRRQPRPSVSPALVVALTAACFLLWAMVAGIACYAIIHTPEWVGWVMLR